MSKKNLIILLVALAIIAGIGILNFWIETPDENEITIQEETKTEEAAMVQVKSLVEEFGKKLQNVYLTSPKEKVKEDIEENYSDFLSPNLLMLWLEYPSKAMGRFTSSPWPDRIEVEEIEKIDESHYKVKGRVIEITSVEAVQGGVADSRDIELIVEKIEGKWLISDITVVFTEEYFIF